MIKIEKLKTTTSEEIFPILNCFLDEIGENALSNESKEIISGAIKEDKISFFVARSNENKIIGSASISLTVTTCKFNCTHYIE